MGCGCNGGKVRGGGERRTLAKFFPEQGAILPDEPCVYCAEKHLGMAYALAHENAYEGINRLKLIGELVSCQAHLWEEHRETAQRVRELRHAIQHRQPVPEESWESLAEALSALTLAESKANSAER